MDERARLGIGMAFQRPPAIRGLKLKDLVKIVNPKADVEGILKKMDFEEFANRDVNRGFSGGEVKRSEMVQLLAQQPDFVMLDEPYSGVDLENIKLHRRSHKPTDSEMPPTQTEDQVGNYYYSLRSHLGLYKDRSGLRYAQRVYHLQRQPQGDHGEYKEERI